MTRPEPDTGTGTGTDTGAGAGESPEERSRALDAATAANRAVGRRLNSGRFVRSVFDKVFPDHWSFMIGEIALYSFVVLLLTGTYLAFFFDPSDTLVVYHGSYVPLKGLTVSKAYASTLDISFDTRAGLVIRQIHHWAALVFVAAIVAHLCRVFFTGAFRKPREINWLIGVGLLLLSIAEGFCGYSLPDDLLSGTGLRIAYSIALSIPLVGEWIAWGVWGGEFPGSGFIGRLFVIHILLIPGAILALISAHMGILWHQKHTQFPGPGRTERNVVGSRLMPAYAAKSAGFFLFTAGILSLLGGLAQINPVWIYGPYEPLHVSAISQPDWYVGFLDGSLRLFLPWEYRGLGHTVSPLFWPGVVLPGLLFTLLAAYPFLEARISGDRAWHHLLQRPRDNPVRTGIGMAALSFFGVLLVSGGNDLFARITDISLNAWVWAGRVGALVVPPLAFYTTYRVCLAAQKRDRHLAETDETGQVRMLPTGRYIEVERPAEPPPEPDLVPAERAAIPAPRERPGPLSRAWRGAVGFFTDGGTT